MPEQPSRSPHRTRLEAILAEGLSQAPIEHAQQVANIAAVLSSSFGEAGFAVTLVGGAAVEIHAPGIYRSGDLDIVIEAVESAHRHRSEVFRSLGFQREGRHWRHGDELFVEVVKGPVEGPTEHVRVREAQFRIVTKEVVLRDRIVGFKHWKYTGYGQQAVDMLAAFGDELDLSWLEPELKREDSLDAFHALRRLATSSEPVTDRVLRRLLEGVDERDDAG